VLPVLFKNEDELRVLWSDPATRKALLEGLADKGFGETELCEIRRLIDAEKSNLHDVLAYIAFAIWGSHSGMPERGNLRFSP
jgi:type I restriction enzyme, R subunit